MGKIIRLIFTMSIVITMTFTLGGCSEDQRKVISSDSIAQANCEAILHALDHDDKEELKALFCNNIKATKELDAQIQAAMDFYEGKTVSYDTTIGAGGGSYGSGKLSGKILALASMTL